MKRILLLGIFAISTTIPAIFFFYHPSTKGMVLIKGGTFWMGNFNNHDWTSLPGDRSTPVGQSMLDTQPWHRVTLNSYWIDKTPVTNQEFEKFVRSTHYITVAERKPGPEEIPEVSPDLLVPGSVVFSPPKHPVPLDNSNRWWSFVAGANWKNPEGPERRLRGREQHPVVQMAWEDADAYCKWLKKRLPTEAEFEFAARGGLDRKRYSWGDNFKPKGRWMANIFQGHFPDLNSGEDGYIATSPVGSFPANGYGLYDMAGNVWEWCSDWYQPDYYQVLLNQNYPVIDPQGPIDSYDPDEPGVKKKVMRGGSFLCSSQFCSRYEVGSRGKGDIHTGTNHLGFRCARSPSKSEIPGL